MEGRADAVIRGGDCTVGLESTILRLSGGRVEILRPGKIGEGEILRVMKKKPSFPEVSGDEPPPAPGMKYRHYSPRAEVLLYLREEEIPAAELRGKKIGVLALGPGAPGGLPADVPVARAASIDEYARRLYAEFFVFDKLGCERIYAVFPPPEGIGDAVRNRLLKAAGGRFLRPPA